MTKLRVIAASLNVSVGESEGNLALMQAAIDEALGKHHADLIVFPELALSGYPPEDLLFRRAYLEELEAALAQLSALSKDIGIIVGHPEQTPTGLFNAVSVLYEGKRQHTYHKQFLPNMQVFDEKRYFAEGAEPCVFDFKGTTVGVIICEDVWHSEPVQNAKDAGAKLLIVPNASPFSVDKLAARQALLRAQARSINMPIIYVNLVGGQDELIFDGGSFAVDHTGMVVSQAPLFESGCWPIDVTVEKRKTSIEPQTLSDISSIEANMYQALVQGVRDYYQKNNFPGIVLGLSGGIDSALTLTIAVDAVGAENVEAILMPSRYTRDISNETAIEQAKTMGVRYDQLSIEKSFTGFLETLADRFKDTHPDVTEQNIQARARGTLLMAVSNKTNYLLLTTGNKSEYAVGYSTLYGDMCGGYAPLKDVYKTMVYRLAQYRNSINPVIPTRVLDRPPSAELAFEQLDQDTLPPYPILDEILSRYIEQEQDAQTIIEAGFDAKTVHDVIRMLYRNEYKRRQAAPGPKVTTKAFGRDRRYPMTCGYIDKK